MKSLRLKNIDVGDTLTVGELSLDLKEEGEKTPIVIKVGNKNYRLVGWYFENSKLILQAAR